MARARVVLVAGTRPEVIKLAPVLAELRRREWCEPLFVASAQHRELTDQALATFGLAADLDLDLMRPGQDLFDVSAGVLTRLRDPLRDLDPAAVLVQGDTTTVLFAALAAFYLGIPVGHVEAGLRSGDLAEPFPEEANRRLTSVVTRWHFAPSARARQALLAEGVAAERVFVTGNTAIDAVFSVRERPVDLAAAGVALDHERPVVLVTVHRRESFGAPLQGILTAVRRLAERFSRVQFVLPVHPNPAVRAPVLRDLSGLPNLQLVEPLDYPVFAHLLDRASFALSDSGGVQEEGPALGTPVLVLRRVTERPEAVEAGGALLVGTEPGDIEAAASELLEDPAALARLAAPRFPYGEGDASRRIADALEAALA
ncbi:MAG: non-hydrolyzing UDP-N-acetylglucosamine 2-epimerase [Planctomycetota bacterium]